MDFYTVHVHSLRLSVDDNDVWRSPPNVPRCGWKFTLCRQLVGKEPGILEPILAAYRVAKADL